MAGVRAVSITYDYYPFDVTSRRLAEAAVDSGDEMDVICIRQPGESPREICNGVNIYRLPITRGFGQSLPATVLNWLWFTTLAGGVVGRLHMQRHYHVIHAHNMPDFVVFSALIPKLFGAKALLYVQDVSPELMAAKARGRKQAVLKTLASAQEWISTRFADAVVTVGWPFERKLLERGVPSRKMHIILNSADPKIFPEERRFSVDDALKPVTPPHDDSAPFIVMYWGTLAQRNGLATAIRALALARREAPNMRLDIMGRGEDIPRLKQIAEAEGVADYVRFGDTVPAEGIVDFITHGDVGIIPYTMDGFADLVLPTKAYELAWLRRPIVASDTPAIRSMFRPESVRLCRPDDPQDFARALIELYQNPALRREMVRSASEDYEPYRWESMAARYTDLLASLAKRSSTPMPAAEKVVSHP